MTGPRLLVHTSVQPIRWGDMDALGHVNNTVYFRYLEQTRIEWVYGLSPVGDGLKALGREDEVRVLDVAELVAAALPAGTPAQAATP